MQVSEFFEPIGMFHRNFPYYIVHNVGTTKSVCCRHTSENEEHEPGS